MAPEDRNRAFDKALSRHLRAAAGAEQGASADQFPGSRPASCLDPETLAAYHERSLHPQEMDSCKEHIVACTHCQAILAELEATDAIPLLASEGEKVVALSSPQSLAAAAGKDRRTAPATFPEKSAAARLPRGVPWRWLAPAGALAAGLLVWIAWHENQPRLLSVPESKVAKLERPPAPEPAPAAAGHAPASSAAADQIASLSKDRELVGGLPSAKKSPAKENLKQLDDFDSRAKSAAGKPLAADANKEFARRDAGRGSSLALDKAQNQPALEAKRADAKNADAKSAETKNGEANNAVSVTTAAETVEVQAPPPSAPAQNQNLNQNQQNQRSELNAQKVVGPSPLGQVEQNSKTKSQSSKHALRPAAAAPASSAAPSAEASLQVAGAAGGLAAPLIAAPGSKAVWRVGPGGFIEYSSGPDASWKRQPSNVLVELTSGSAPSANVCWIVGRAGTILLTTDAGSHWNVLHSPLDQDLGGIRATDALHATVWNSAKTKTFQTADGGLTWKLVSPQ